MDDWEASSEENLEPREPIDMPSPSEAPEGEEVEGEGGDKDGGVGEGMETAQGDEVVEHVPDTIPETQIDVEEPPLLEDGQGWWNVDKSPSPNNAATRALVDPSQVDTLPFEIGASEVFPATGATGSGSFAPVNMSTVDARIAFLQCLSIKFVLSV